MTKRKIKFKIIQKKIISIENYSVCFPYLVQLAVLTCIPFSLCPPQIWLISSKCVIAFITTVDIIELMVPDLRTGINVRLSVMAMAKTPKPGAT